MASTYPMGMHACFFLSAIQLPETESTCASEMCAKGLFTLRDGDRRRRTTTLRWV